MGYYFTLRWIGFSLQEFQVLLGIQFLPFINILSIQFFPQGLSNVFLRNLGCYLGLYIWIILLWDLGEGFNEFNFETGQFEFSDGDFLEKIDELIYNITIEDIQSIRVEIQEGLNPKRVIYLRLQGNREIPLTRAGQPS